MTDLVLVERAKGGDELAFRRLLDRHRDLIEIHVSRYFVPGGDRDDLFAEGLFGLYKAVRDFDAGYRTTFRGFASLVISRQVTTAVKTATRNKHTPVNHGVPIDIPLAQGQRTLSETFADPRTVEPFDILAERQEVAELVDALGALSPLEQAAVVGFAEGRSYGEIASEAGANYKAVDNALQRGRRKLGRLIGVAPGVRAEAKARRHRTDYDDLRLRPAA